MQILNQKSFPSIRLLAPPDQRPSAHSVVAWTLILMFQTYSLPLHFGHSSGLTRSVELLRFFLLELAPLKATDFVRMRYYFVALT